MNKGLQRFYTYFISTIQRNVVSAKFLIGENKISIVSAAFQKQILRHFFTYIFDFFIGEMKFQKCFSQRKTAPKVIFQRRKMKKVINTPMKETVENILHSPIVRYRERTIFDQTLN